MSPDMLILGAIIALVVFYTLEWFGPVGLFLLLLGAWWWI